MGSSNRSVRVENMDGILKISEEERRSLLRNAAQEMGIHEAITEKEKSAEALIGLLAGHEVDLDQEREERILQ